MDGTYDAVQVFHPPRRARELGCLVGVAQAQPHVPVDDAQFVLGLASADPGDGGQVLLSNALFLLEPLSPHPLLQLAPVHGRVTVSKLVS